MDDHMERFLFVLTEGLLLPLTSELHSQYLHYFIASSVYIQLVPILSSHMLENQRNRKKVLLNDLQQIILLKTIG